MLLNLAITYSYSNKL